MTADLQPSAADSAVKHILRRIRTEPRLAWFMCPLTETFQLLTEAAAQATGEPVEKLRQRLDKELRFQDPQYADAATTELLEASFKPSSPSTTRASFDIDNELLARVALVGGGDAFKDEMHANTVLAHLVRLGLEQMEDQLLNTDQEELF